MFVPLLKATLEIRIDFQVDDHSNTKSWGMQQKDELKQQVMSVLGCFVLMWRVFDSLEQYGSKLKHSVQIWMV